MRARIAAVAAVAVVALAGCGGSDEATELTDSSVDMEQVFLDAMRGPDGPPRVAYFTDAELVDLGRDGCHVMGSMSFIEFMEYGMDEVGPNADWDGMGALLGAASATLCPEHAGWAD